MSRYYDKQGNSITPRAYRELHCDYDYVVVCKTQLDDDTEVSTVWLGADHRFTDYGPPIIFETMIFRGGNGDECWRYSTEAEAIKGHDLVCQGKAPYEDA